MYSKCQKCGRKLTDPESVARGYGPECWGDILEIVRSAMQREEQLMPGQMTIDDFLREEKTERGDGD